MPFITSSLVSGLVLMSPNVTGLPQSHPALSSSAACSWQIMPTPNRNPGAMANFLSAATVISSDDAWAVGGAYVPEEGGRGRTLILHWDGFRWRAVRHPQGRDDALLAVSAASATDVWSVGLGHPQGLILHWDGTLWRRVLAENPRTRFWHLEDVVAFAHDDAWAVGVTVNNGVGAPLIEHWDGVRWNVVASPDPPQPEEGVASGALTAVAGSSPSDVWAVGAWNVGGPSGSFDGLHTLIEHWDGDRWAIIASPDAPDVVRITEYLVAASAAGPSDAWAVGLVTKDQGFGGRPDRQLLEHWDGTAWRVSPGAVLPGRTSLSDVVAMTPQEAWAVGSAQAQPVARTLIERWNGTSWTDDSTPVVSGSLFGVAAGSSGEIWAVGGAGYRHQRTLAMLCRPRTDG
jgi:hypothetical protein